MLKIVCYLWSPASVSKISIKLVYFCLPTSDPGILILVIQQTDLGYLLACLILSYLAGGRADSCVETFQQHKMFRNLIYPNVEGGPVLYCQIYICMWGSSSSRRITSTTSGSKTSSSRSTRVSLQKLQLICGSKCSEVWCDPRLYNYNEAGGEHNNLPIPRVLSCHVTSRDPPAELRPFN